MSEVVFADLQSDKIICGSYLHPQISGEDANAVSHVKDPKEELSRLVKHIAPNGNDKEK